MASKSLIRTAQHSTKFANPGKLDTLRVFLNEYQQAVRFYVDHLWDVGTSWVSNKGDNKVLDISNDKFDIPPFISTTNLYLDLPSLSAKMHKSASGQAIGIVSSVVARIRRTSFRLSVAIATGNVSKAAELQLKLDKLKRAKPDANIRHANLDSNTVDFITSNRDGVEFKQFDGFLRIVSMSKTLGYIEIPIKFHRHTNNLKKRGYRRKTTWVVRIDSVCSTWERPVEPIKASGHKVGADQGVKTCLTLSDGQVTGICPHGHTLESIMHKVTRCQRGSKGFARAQKHRANHINFAVKQLNMSDINEIGFERVHNIRHGKNTSKLLKAWTYTIIKTAIVRRCDEAGVQFSEQSSIYRSQRCSSCGFVHKKSRKGKDFTCTACGHHLDADLNGAINHEIDLPDIPFSLMSMKLNISGFYWLKTGMFDVHGEEITIPQQQNLTI